MKLNKNEEALEAASNCVKHNPDFIRGYCRKVFIFYFFIFLFFYFFIFLFFYFFIFLFLFFFSFLFFFLCIIIFFKKS